MPSGIHQPGIGTTSIGVSRITLDTSELDRLTAELKPRMEDAINATAFEVEGDAKIMAAVDTGAMRGSGYTSTSEGSGYGSSIAEAMSRNPKALIMDEVPRSEGLSAIIAFAVNYAIYQELGTSKMAAHPFLVPAMEQNYDKLVERIAKVFK